MIADVKKTAEEKMKAFEENGTRRQSFWQQKLGDGYLAISADPTMLRAEVSRLHSFATDIGKDPAELTVALIDGMHYFEFALRDFMNLERLCTPDSTILIHDCFPHDRRTAQRERVSRFWSGDVWRLVVLLKKYRPDLQIHVVAAPPTGLGVVRNLDPASHFIAENLGRLYQEFMALDYAFLEKDRAGKLNLFPNDWEQVRRLLGGGAAQSAGQL